MAPGQADSGTARTWWALLALGFASLACYAAVTHLSFSFIPYPEPGEQVVKHEDRPIPAVLAWFGVAFVCYLAGAVVVKRWPAETVPSPLAKGGLQGGFGRPSEEPPPYPPLRKGGRERLQDRYRQLTQSPLFVILFFALAFRLFQLVASPIQEIDIYRYLWDGRVAAAGINPYAYSPAEIESKRVDPQSSDGQRLAELRSHPSVEKVFQRVHHRSVPTIYPPASQAVFALVSLAVPPDTSVSNQILCMKLVLVLFDLGTVGLLIALLRALGKPATWCLFYAWCPLVIKEIANSGHLDAIAIFFTTLMVLLLVRGDWSGKRLGPWSALVGLVWAAAILAKFYPVILLPLVVRQLWNRGRWLAVCTTLAVTGVLMAGTYALLWPGSRPSPFGSLPVFLTEFEMNDSVFSILQRGMEGLLGPNVQQSLTSKAWWPRPVFVPVEPSFLLTYLLVGVLLGMFMVWLSLRRPAASEPSSADNLFVEGVFYALAVQFLLSPTANPWYLMWALPFLAWARQGSWFLLTGLVLQYYLRFWFIYQYPRGEPVAGTGLDAYDFFDKVWVWVEYGPFFVALAVELLWKRLSRPLAA